MNSFNPTEFCFYRKNGFATKPSSYRLGGYFIPTKKIMPYYCGKSDSHGLYSEFVYLAAGTVSTITATGITENDQNNKNVTLELSIKPNEVGELFGVKSTMTIITNYKLFDDGWRFEKILWEESIKNDPWIDKEMHGFFREIDCINAVLRNMHKKKIYSTNYSDLLEKLEKSNDYMHLDTVAWVYKDNGDKNKAIIIYKERVLPAVKKEGGDIQKYEKYLVEISK